MVPWPNDSVQKLLGFASLLRSMLQPWSLRYSNFETFDRDPPMLQKSTVKVTDNRFSLFVPIGSMFTVTTLTSGHKGSFDQIPSTSPSFPLDYTDDFQSTPESQNARRVVPHVVEADVPNSTNKYISGKPF